MQSKMITDNMPARRRTGTSSSPNFDVSDKEVAYKLKRKRNNDAVKKTREKSKQMARRRKENVEKLRISNKQLEAKIEEVKKNVEKLKEILLHKVSPKQHEQAIKKILEESSDADD
ncbi:CCAAT/enhancer-binding protein gamma [Glossina fuscipes]|uniref:CCAAT/enhancer-binding protein gamma n=2 Tax=Nemorhina TaxID=44051 RepID=A0A8U0W8A9_9MUSC|nr:CCAAT/enhancer-binding protein gamma [Glossina fuscipes]XP_037881480.1 CCAAT/enhancer-binding protein gamma [Glossina fuscipes]XP_037881481.1 CCAAT/enhancer-binding protein gamma [Glossina fuscipes]